MLVWKTEYPACLMLLQIEFGETEFTTECDVLMLPVHLDEVQIDVYCSHLDELQIVCLLK